MNYKLLKKFFLFFIIIILVASCVPDTYAANGTLSVVPATGNYSNGETFTAQIKIDGGGTAFNASKARIAVSPNIVVEGLTLGDCNFAFVETPSVSSLSFAGVILGGFTESCTVYTLNLKVNGANNGFIFISDAAIKAREGAIELFSKANNSSYTFTGGGSSIVPSPTQAPLALDNGEKYYTVVYTVPPIDPRMSVVMDPETPTKVVETPEPHPDNPTVLAATFDNVSEGVHTIAVLKRDKELSKEIVNIKGDNREISLGVVPEEKGQNYIIYLLISGIAVLLLSGVVFGYIFYWRRRQTYQG